MEILLRDGPSKMSADFKPFARADDFLTEFLEHFCLNGHDGPPLRAFLSRGGFKIITLRYADQIAHKLENGQASRQDDSPIKDVSPVKEVYTKQAREYRARYEELQQSTTKEKKSMMSLLTQKEESQRNLVNNLGDVYQKEGAANRGLVQDLAKKQGDQVASVMKAQGEHLKMQGEQFSAALKTQGEQHASVVDKFSGMHLESQVTVRAAIAALETGQGVPAPSVQATATMSTGNEETAPAPAPFVQATAPSVQSTTATVSTDDETGADTVWMPVNEMTNAQLAEELVNTHGFPADVNKLKKTNKYILVSMVEDKRKQHKN